MPEPGDADDRRRWFATIGIGVVGVGVLLDLVSQRYGVAVARFVQLVVLALSLRVRPRPRGDGRSRARLEHQTSPWAAWRGALRLVTQDWVRPLHIAAICLAPLIAAYFLIVVGLNSFAFHYSFWNDVPPSAWADHVAVASLWALAVLAVISLGWFYVALCRVPAHVPRPARAHETLRSLGDVRRHFWWVVVGVTAVLVTSIALVGVLLIPVLAPAPFTSDRPGSRRYVDMLRRNGRQLWLAPVAAVVVVAMLWYSLEVGTTDWSGLAGVASVAGLILAAALAIESCAVIAELGRSVATEAGEDPGR